MVDGGVSPGPQAALRCLFNWAAIPSARLADPICRLRQLAAGVDEGRGVGEPEFLLEERIGWGAINPGIAHGQAASRRAKLPWCDGNLSAARKAVGAAENLGARAASHVVHDFGSWIYGI